MAEKISPETLVLTAQSIFLIVACLHHLYIPKSLKFMWLGVRWAIVFMYVYNDLNGNDIAKVSPNFN